MVSEMHKKMKIQRSVFFAGAQCFPFGPKERGRTNSNKLMCIINEI